MNVGFHLSIIKEENNNNNNNNNNSLQSETLGNDDEYSSENQSLQNLASTLNTDHQNDTNDSLLALAVALRSTSNISPIQSNRQQNTNRNYTSTSSLISEKIPSTNLNDLNTENYNRQHRTHDLRGM